MTGLPSFRDAPPAPRPWPDLPVAAVLDEIVAALGPPGSSAVVVAPPGAGKTTLVPLALALAPWCRGRVVVVEPRRLAARAAAERMAAWFGERVGVTVGLRMRGDSRVSSRTRIEVVTEGVLTRLLQDDPSLDGTAAVVFDEFHERSLDADVGLALTLDARAALAPELRVVAMSATVDGAAVASLLDRAGAPVVTCDAHVFGVETVWCGPSTPVLDPSAVASACRRALREHEGDVLVFLPGAPEIRRVARALATPPAPDGVDVLPLHGTLPAREQDRALAPAPPGRRKVVLATSIAETSLTIDGVRVVVDAGFARTARYDARRAIGALVTVRVSQAAADQRRGRAGRTAPGVAYRLWSEAEHALLAPQAEPELRHADLTGLALDLVRWGDPDGASLRWLDPPSTATLAHARELLAELGLLDAHGRLTDHGRACAALPLHPRLAHCLVRAGELGHGALACDVAALLGERDLLSGTRDAGPAPADLRRRVDVLRHRGGGPAGDRARAEAARLRRLVGERDGTGRSRDVSATDASGLVLALAYPDRIARRRDTAAGRFLLVNGAGAACDEHDSLARSDWLAIADLDAGAGGDRVAGDARIRLAAPLDERDVLAVAGDRVTTVDVSGWDRRRRDVAVRRERRLGAVVLAVSRLDDRAATVRALVEGVRIEGLTLLPRLDEAAALRDRVGACRRTFGDEWPDLGDEALLDALDDWLVPALHRLASLRGVSGLAQVDVAAALRDGLLAWPLPRRLDELAPTQFTAPTGTRVRIDYAGEEPSAAVKMQELYGCLDTPRVLGGRVPVVLHLLSPAGRPLQVTRDLAGFWAGSYAQVRAEMRGRYPKHDWPDDPAHATPSRGVRRR